MADAISHLPSAISHQRFVMDWDEMALVGRIARAHGIRGQVIVNADTDFPEERFQAGSTLFVQRGGQTEPMTVTSVRFHRERPVIGLQGVDTMSDAEALAGLELRVPRSTLTALPEGTFYRHDLIGCKVETTEGRPVGVVTDVEGTIGGSRLVVDGGSAGEILVPLAAAICTAIDPAAKRIVIDPPDGLIALNARSG
jgi:16S rRNA processing protein RimM